MWLLLASLSHLAHSHWTPNVSYRNETYRRSSFHSPNMHSIISNYILSKFRMWESIQNVRKWRNGSRSMDWARLMPLSSVFSAWNSSRSSPFYEFEIQTQTRADFDSVATEKKLIHYNIKFSACKRQMVLHSIDFSFIHLFSALCCHYWIRWRWSLSTTITYSH